jgi:dTDP-4-dehydrorhamnose 3,5-epimerase
MNIINCKLPEVKLIEQFRHNDARGAFVKNFQVNIFKENGINFELKESFYSTNNKNVLRGFHYHEAPYEHAKIVFCTQGQILDVAIDIRKESPTFGEYVSEVLSFENNKSLYIPKGFAHGFLTLSETATVFYLVDGVYHSEADKGILYSSINIEWPSTEIITNERDKSFPKINEI